MPIAYVGAASAVGELALNVANSGGSSGANGYYGGQPGYVPQNQPGADSLYQSLFTDSGNYAQQGNPYVNNLQNNPYAGQAQTGADTAANYGLTNVAPQMAGAANNLYGAGNSVLQVSQDPQQNLYNQMQQQTLDQSNAINSMSGLSGTPYGAGIAGNNLNNFNINWQNQQLQRQAQGIQSAGQAYTGAAGLGTTAMNTYAGSAALPYSTYAGQQNANLAALGQGQTLDANAINPLATYLGLGQTATGLAQSGAQNQFANNSAIGSSIGQGLSSLSGLFSNSGSSSSAGTSSGSNSDYITNPNNYNPGYYDSQDIFAG